MSEVKLNLVDAERGLHGTIHGSVADRCVAALSAEPETIGELEAALNRYIKPLTICHSRKLAILWICLAMNVTLINGEKMIHYAGSCVRQGKVFA